MPLIFYQQRVDSIDVPPSVLPLPGCTDTYAYGEIKYGTQVVVFLLESKDYQWVHKKN